MLTAAERRQAIEVALSNADRLPERKIRETLQRAGREQAVQTARNYCQFFGRYGHDLIQVEGRPEGLKVMSRDRTRKGMISWSEVVEYVANGGLVQESLFGLQPR